ncbi:MAG: tRNA preQ1(34) S-adenosylmethionine ribosyltransferase-isomerase QueA [Candidatus Omnitrophica bacterium]|jgi:S-adenosylmethionine:tRNA ribosyltransferase-isomerase|nr:tRNA preQ1(34) S-adenosylmethionine ribosyltransferase-isomerase QueA [Candidatus Omnitrophota bacterium]
MKLAEFDYHLPKELIAQYPLKERDEARLLVVHRADGKIEHCSFKDFTGYLSADDLLVLNNTKVLASRLEGKRKTGGRVEVLLLKRNADSIFHALIKPARLKLNEEILFNHGSLKAVIVGRQEIRFSDCQTGKIYDYGQMPLPPYIKRKPEALDSVYYQTIYAKHAGAVASPTAGLHFTDEILKNIASKGINIAYVTLHVGHGTFKPVVAEDIKEHKMEGEDFFIDDQAIGLINQAREKKGKIFSVGTTSSRALETLAGGKKEGSTNLFIYPGYKFKMVDCLLTNFHLPRTTLFMLVCAFSGEKLAKEAYAKAIEQKYRFYSYGDAMLIL